MLGKLAIRNAFRSIRDYRIYIITVTIAFALMYAFNMIVFSEDIMMLNRMMLTFAYMVVFISVLVVFVIGWLVHYMTKFMLHRRSKELGTYMVLGISNRAITRLFLAENIIIGGISFLLGMIFGTFLYQVLTMIIMHIFEAVYEVKLVFSVKAFSLTILYIILIYCFSLLRMKRKIGKMKIYDLLHAEKQNEIVFVKHQKGDIILMTIALLTGITGAIVCKLTFQNGDNVQMGAIGIFFTCFIVCIYCFYISVSHILIRFFVNRKAKQKNAGTLVLVRNLSSKINTMSMTLGTLALLLTLTLSFSQIATLFKNFFDMQGNSVCPYEIMMWDREGGTSFIKEKEYLDEKLGGVTQEHSFMVYDSGANQVGKYLDGTPVEMSFWGNDTVMAYSDYCKMRKQLGYEKIDLKKGHFIVQGVSGVKTVLDKEQPKFQIEGETLSYQACYTEGFALEGDLGAYLILVLPDEYAEKLDIYEAVYAADTEKKSAPEDYENLCRIIEPLEDGEEMDGEDYIPVGNVNVKGAVLGENRTMFTIISFSMFYIALIFCCTALTVLAVQQLSESEKHGKRYRILSELGMPQEGVEKIIRRQVGVYFLMPLVLPIPLSICCTLSLNQLFQAYTGPGMLISTISASLGLFFLVYILYLAATYVGYRNSVKS